VESAGLLAGGAELKVEASGMGPVLTLPAAAPDPICSTIKLIVTGKPKIAEARVSADADGVIRLLPADAKFTGSMKVEEKAGIPNIGFWLNPKESVSWKLLADHDGAYVVQMEIASPAAGSVILVQGIGKLACSIPKTDSHAVFQTVKVGEVTLKKGARLDLSLHPVADGWNPVNVRKVELVPQP
jgi:hypothetical protein